VGLPASEDEKHQTDMNVIFLDIDGVLNTAGSLRRSLENQSYSGFHLSFDHGAVENLNKVVESTKAHIVIISSWRFHHTVESMQQLFTENGIRANINGFTGSCFENVDRIQRHNREQEILNWLEEQHETPNFVVLDDEGSNYLRALQPRLVRCDPLDGFGNEERLRAAMALMKK